MPYDLSRRPLRAVLNVIIACVLAVTTAPTPCRVFAAEPDPNSPTPNPSATVDSEWLAAPGHPAGVEVPSVLTLETALFLTERYNPSLRGAGWNLRRSEGIARDAGKRPNPELVGEAENFAWDMAPGNGEWTVALRQVFELGGDRLARASATGQEQRAAAHALDGERLDALAITSEAFLTAWSAQERHARLLLAEELARDVVRAAAERHREGAAPEVDRLRAEVNVGLLVAARRRAEAEMAAGRRRLAAQWGLSEAGFDSLSLPDPPDAAPAVQETLFARMPWHPSLQRAEAEGGAAEARVRAAHAARVPDLGISLGYRRLSEAEANTLVAAIALPLPIWNGGGGRVEAAEAERSAAQSVLLQSRVTLERSARDAIDRLDAALDAHGSMVGTVLPAARQTLVELQRGYRAGRYAILDLLAGQRSALDAEISSLEAAQEVWSAYLALQRLAGAARPIPAKAGGTP